MLNDAAAASGGRFDAVTLCPGRICGPMLFGKCPCCGSVCSESPQVGNRALSVAQKLNTANGRR